MLSRRAFLERSSFALAAMSCLPAFADSSARGPLGKAIGIQLYTVREETAKNLLGTLQQLSTIGFREVEMAGYYGKSAKELRKLLLDLNLNPTSTHHSLADALKDTQAKIDYAAELGVRYLVVSSPAVPDNRFDNQPQGSTKTIWNSMTLNDWKWVSEQLNKIGKLSKKAGIQTGYHNHNSEFRATDGVVPYDELIKRTDPSLVTLELDIAWVVAAGFDPVAYLKKHPERISLLHIKDVKKDIKIVLDETETETTEVGSGQIDWRRLFAACDPKRITNYYYEQENFDRPILDAAKISFDYLSKLKV